MFDLENFKIEELKELKKNELGNLADDIASFIIEQNSITGGHVGANLGTVDASLAIHYVFNTPEDVIVWDTGHTGYTHKILTGRGHLFKSLNSFGGMNRFISSAESEHDFVEVSHAGTSISIALGNAVSNKKKKNNNFSIAFIGDGSLVEGVAFEALNHAVKEDVNLIILLNDNGHAISPGFGGIHDHLQDIQNSKESKNIFTLLDYNYHGPLNGHSSEALIDKLQEIKKSGGVHLVHIVTEKGYRYEPAHNHPLKMHYSFPFTQDNGKLKDPSSNLVSFQTFAADAIQLNMRKDENIVAITPSTLYATDLDKVFNEFPDRTYDPGMEEQHAMSFACGLARSGTYPVIFYQSTFLQRAFDQLIHDIGFSNNNILILSVRSGFSGYDNPTHHGIYDISYLRSIPNLEIFYPSNGDHLFSIVDDILKKPSGPKLVLMPYGFDEKLIPSKQYNTEEDIYGIDKILEGNDCLILCLGNKVNDCIKTSEELKNNNISASIINLNKVKPIDSISLSNIISKYKYVFSVEENISSGGLNELISKIILENNLDTKYTYYSLPNEFIQGGSHEELSKKYELDPVSLARKISSKINK
jgi:1-deoxy-D-xylulose-5-phosphate synthase